MHLGRTPEVKEMYIVSTYIDSAKYCKQEGSQTISDIL